MPDHDGYPTRTETQAIYDFTGSPREFVEYINSIWWHDGFTVKNGRNTWGGVKRCYLSTWGWSGNEEIMDYIDQTWFSMRFWESHRRGGHYIYEVPTKEWDKPTEFMGAILDKYKSKGAKK